MKFISFNALWRAFTAYLKQYVGNDSPPETPRIVSKQKIWQSTNKQGRKYHFRVDEVSSD